jgi:hypothetical protein
LQAAEEPHVFLDRGGSRHAREGFSSILLDWRAALAARQRAFW